MAYSIFKFVHVLGVIALVGNVTVTAVWKVFADRSRCQTTIAFAQRLVTYTDWSFTLAGILLIVVGGYGMAILAHLRLFEIRWLLVPQICFLLSGLIWACVLLPAQIEQAQLAREFQSGQKIAVRYWELGSRWIAWGVAATVPLVYAIFVMITKG